MKPPRLRSVQAPLLALLAACGGSDGGTGTPDPDPTLSVSPSSLALELDEMATLQATVQGTANTAVNFESAEAAIASVDASGVVTAEGAGSTTITARLAADPTITDEVTVVVAAGARSLTLLDSEGQPLDLQDVSGTFEVAYVVSVPESFEGAIEVLIDDVLVGSAPIESVAAAAAPGPDGSVALATREVTGTVQAITTADIAELALPDVGEALNSNTVPRFIPNGQKGITINIRGAGQSTGVNQPIVIDGVFLTNQDAVIIAHDLERVEVLSGPQGSLYGRGPARGAILNYTGRNYQRAEVGFADGSFRTDVDLTDGDVGHLFLDDSQGSPFGVAEVEGPITWKLFSTTLVGGGAGTTRLANAFPEEYPGIQSLTDSYDGRDPRTSGYVWPRGNETFFGLNTRWNAEYGGIIPGENLIDEGAGLTDDPCALALGPDYGNLIYHFEPGALVGPEIGERNADLVAALLCRDRGDQVLEFQLGAEFRIGADLTLPVGGFVNDPPGTTIQPNDISIVGKPFRAHFLDDGISAGFSQETGYKWRMGVYYPEAPPEDNCLVGIFEGGVCGWAAGGPPVLEFPFQNRQGYYRAEVIGMDGSGNMSLPDERWGLHDITSPFTQHTSVPDIFTPGGPFSIGFSATDNVDLLEGIGGFSYGTGPARIFFVDEPVVFPDPPFDLSLNATATWDHQGNFIRSVERVIGDPFDFDGIVRNAETSVGAGVDAAGNFFPVEFSISARFDPRIGALGPGAAFAASFPSDPGAGNPATIFRNPSDGPTTIEIRSEFVRHTPTYPDPLVTEFFLYRQWATPEGAPLLYDGAEVWYRIASTPVGTASEVFGDFEAQIFLNEIDASVVKPGLAKYAGMFGTPEAHFVHGFFFGLAVEGSN